MSVYDSYRLYNSLKLHFNSESYNYFKYSGKIKSRYIPEHQFYIFEKLDKKYGDNLEDFYVSNFLENPKTWINDLLSEDCGEIYLSYVKRKESLTYSFKTDIIYLFDESDDFNKLFVVDKDFPLLMKKTLQNKIKIETLLILNSILQFFGVWDNKIKDDLIWKDFRLKCIKYFPFVKFDQTKMKEILKMEIKKYAK